jgi:hypothetical protein
MTGMATEPGPSRTTLILFGGLQALFGAGVLLSGCTTWIIHRLLDVLEKVPARAPEGGGVLLLLGAWSLACGVGILRGRKWAWALALAQDLFLVLLGAYGVTTALFWMPDLLWNVPPGAVPAARALAGRWMGEAAFLSLLAVFGAAQLAVFLLPGTRSAFEERDPGRRWTDLCPLPVLMWCLYGGVGFVSGSAELFDPDGRADFFGVELAGGAAAAVSAVNAGLLAWTTIGMFRLERSSWILVLIVDALWTVSGTLTLLNTPLAWHFRESVLANEALALLPDPAFMAPWVTTLVPLVITVFEYAYLYRLRGYFKRR